MLPVRPGSEPSGKPPVRIFVGTEPAQHRALRVLLWSIERARDPGRVYEITLMENLPGFDPSAWLTGFTGYRFAIPGLAGGSGRAIYNDVDQVYLADPGELYDTEMGDHGFLTVPPLGAKSTADTSVMLLDCQRMAEIWPPEAARSEPKRALLARAAAHPGLRGDLAPEWNACDTDYRAGRSKLLHYTIIHQQPWRPVPARYAYQRNPVAHVWHELERSADAAGYEIFSLDQPSRSYRDSVRLLTADSTSQERIAVTALSADERTALEEVVKTSERQRILAWSFGGEDASIEMILARAGAAETVRASGAHPASSGRDFDGVVAVRGFDRVPDADLPWVIAELFARARRFVWISVEVEPEPARRSPITRLPRTADTWRRLAARAAARHPHVHWRLLLRGPVGEARIAWGGRPLSGRPRVWVLGDGKAGHTTQSLGLAQALGWPAQVKELRFSPLAGARRRLRWLAGSAGASQFGLDARRSSALAPPWPDVVVSAGWRPAPVARWIAERSGGRTKLVQLGRQGGYLAGDFDAAVTCAHFDAPTHPNRVETTLPFTRVTPELLKEERESWPGLVDEGAYPKVVLLVGGATRRFRFDSDDARRLGARVAGATRAAGGKLYAVTSPRTGEAACAALAESLGPDAHLHRWRADEAANPYLAYLASADVLIVTGESESMLAEAAGAGRPLYVFALAERREGPITRLTQAIVSRARSGARSRRGREKPQRGLTYLCARLVERGVARPRRDLTALHAELERRSIARPLSDRLDLDWGRVPGERADVAERVREKLGIR